MTSHKKEKALTTAAAAPLSIVARPPRPFYKADPNKKCAIVGFASSSRNMAPFNDPSFEIWGLNSLYALIPRWDRWFEIHPKEHVVKDLHRAELQQIGVEHHKWLQQQAGPTLPDGTPNPAYKPIFMQEAYPDIPASVAWPRAEINAWTTAMFGPEAELDYFTSTPGEMVVHAIFEGYGEIHLYGIDLLQDEEYAYQRPGCEYWVGVARGLGIKVVVPSSSSLLKANYVYGYSEPTVEFGATTPLVNFWKEKATQIEQLQHQAAAILNTINGARQLLDAVGKRIAGGETTEQLAAYLKLESENLTKRFDTTRDELNKLGGQRELAQSAASWTGHFGRGGKLEGM